MATLYLHAGISKTGTKAIQRFCRVNKAALARMGFCYPIFPRKYAHIRLQKNAHFLVKYMQMEDGSARESLWREHMDYVARLFRKYPNVLLSDETLWHSSRFHRFDMWERLKREAEGRGYQIKLIVYLRRQDELLSSWWAQMIKENRIDASKLTWSELLAHPEDSYPVDYAEQLDRISAVIGRENVQVRVYDRSRFLGGDLLRDFLDALGLEKDGRFSDPAGDPNISVGGDMLEILRQLSLLPEFSAQMWSIAPTAAVNCTRSGPRVPKASMYTPEELRGLLGRYAESNRRVARDYLGLDAPLFAPPPAELPPRWSPEGPEMYASVIRYFGELTRLQAEALRNERSIAHRLRQTSEKLGTGLRVYADYLLLR